MEPMTKKKKKKKKTSHFMKGKLRLCFENGLARVLNQKYLDSKAWSDVLLLSDMGERKKKGRTKSYEWLRTDPNNNQKNDALKTEVTWQKAICVRVRKD